jgi:N4-gp56 family major capsid protein
MARFKLISANDKTTWSTNYAQEYVAESGLSPYMSTSKNAIIVVDKELSTSAGSTINFTYFKKLSGGGVIGGDRLKGNEENMQNYTTSVRVKRVRNAVVVSENESFRTELDVINIARDELKSWSAEKLRDDAIVAAQAVIVKGANDDEGNPTPDTYVSWATATDAQKDAFLSNNADRVLFGSVRANTKATMAASLTAIPAAQKLSAGVLTMAKAMARKTAAFRIRPYRSDATAGREWFVLFVDSEGFRDLAADPLIYAANKDARPNDVEKNPIFQSGDMIYAGIIIREIPELTAVGNVGASGARVGHAVLCGQRAVAVAYAKMPTPVIDTDDYQGDHGVGIVEIRGQAKLSAAGVQTGIVSIFHASALDA